jgi:hypothetical protein
MNDDKLKEAFSQVKQDIFLLGNELHELKFEMTELKSELRLVSQFIDEIRTSQFANPTPIPTDNPTYNKERTSTKDIPTDNPTLPQETGGLISPKLEVSTGNRGVPTDRPTNKPTDQHIPFIVDKVQPSALDRASEILTSLDNLKKEVRIKFKRLTSQEMQVFSILYGLEEQGISVDYSIISQKMNLSESSIRDYIGKIQKKGIPILKEKLNNKRVILHISPDLKKIASLNTILQLREL